MDDWTAQHAPGRLVPYAAHVVAADPEIGERIVQIAVPLFAAAFRLYRHYGLGEASVLRQERRIQYVNRFDRIFGYRSGRICPSRDP